MSVLDSAFQNMQVTEDYIAEQNSIREAESAGFSFVQLVLKKRARTDMIHQAGFVNIVQVYVDPLGMSGQQSISFVIKQQNLIFRYDPRLRRHVAYMLLDDDLPKNAAGIEFTEGIFSERGFNLDWLATHYPLGEIDINDQAVLAEIKKRIQVAEKQPKIQPHVDKHLTKEEMDKIAVEDIDAQIAHLQNIKKQMQGAQPQQQQAPIPQQPPAPPKQQEQQKVDVNILAEIV